MKDNVLILAIESSCDETAASVIENGRNVLSNIISSQIEIHKEYGGVVPEVASRKHIENINDVVEEALKKAEIDSYLWPRIGGSIISRGQFRKRSFLCLE